MLLSLPVLIDGPWEPHQHEVHELVVCLTDNALFCTEQQQFDFRKGRAFLVQAGVSHYFDWDGEQGGEGVKPAEAILVCFDDRTLERLVSPALQPQVKQLMDGECVATSVCLEREADNVRFARQLMNAINAQAPFYQEEVSSLLNLLLLNHLKAIESSDAVEVSAHFKKVRGTLRWIEKNLEEEINIDVAASQAQMSRAVFTKYFKKYTDSTLADYVSNARLDKAALLLSDASLSIAETAHQSGHRNLGHFYKRFQHRFDLTPSRYRNLMLEQRQESKGIK